MREIAAHCIVMFLVIVFSGLFTGGDQAFSQLRDADFDALEISKYKSWTLVNPKPLRLPASLDILCSAPTTEELVATSRNPHRRKFFTVYVNEVGRDAMMREANPGFAQGSIIVKEKLVDENGGKAELLTAMIKREPGFNTGSGNWEYLVLDGKGVKVEARGKLENCQSCHSTMKQTDYVFRSYLPANLRQTLR